MESKAHVIYQVINDFKFYCETSGNLKVITIPKGNVFIAFKVSIESFSRKANNDVCFIESLECVMLYDSILCKCTFHTDDNKTIDYYLKEI